MMPAAPPVAVKPVAERLQVKRDRRLAVLAAPPGLDGAIGATDARASIDAADVVLLFAPDRAAMDAVLPPTLAAMRADAMLWLAYPKQGTPIAGDLHRDLIRAAMPAHGLDTVAQIAIDAHWSALRLKRTG